jgi:F-type H+-transporting ATPase subunit delta
VSARDAVAVRRYARGLLEVAREQGEAVAETTRAELDALARVVERDEGVRHILFGRPHGPEARRRAAAAVAAAARLQPLTARVVELLAAHDRLALVPSLAAAYGAAWNAARGIVDAEAVSAAPLEAEDERKLTAALERAFGARVALRVRVDPAVLGGLLVNARGRTYDGTVRGRLRALRHALVASR